MMKNPDLLITWHESCDYPLARRFLRRYREFFGKIIIYFSKHFREPIYIDFLKNDLQELGNIVFLDPIEYKYGVEDWRNVSTNYMLTQTNSDWICSVEQDFFARDWKGLFSAITEASKTYDFLGYKGYQGQAEHQTPYLKGDYVHPAFWFIKRELLEKTSKDFSANTIKGADHFGLITQDIQNMQIPIWYTQDHGFPESEAFHQGGINYNYLEGLKPNHPFHRGEQFKVYNYWGMFAGVSQSSQFLRLCQEMAVLLDKKYPEIHPETSSWKEFYL